MKSLTLLASLAVITVFTCLAHVRVSAAPASDARRVLFIAGPHSHGPGEHEFPSGCTLLAEALNRSGFPIVAEVSVGWPASDAGVEAADLLVLYSDGLADHVAKGRGRMLQQRLVAKKSLAVLHFAVEPPEDDVELRQVLLTAVGGVFEANWSVNPVWKLRAPVVATHPAARGIRNLDIEDEWYYHLRFREGLRGIQPLLTALPPADSVAEDGPRTGNPTVRAAIGKGERQILAWTSENENGARGFGFTGGHFHRNWYDDNFRKLVLNGLAWTAGSIIPEAGVNSRAPSAPLYATIDEAIARGDADDVKRHLANSPAQVNGLAGAKLTPLHQAVLRRKPAIVLLLLESGADIQTSDAAGRSPLHMAVERGAAEIVAALLQRKADLGGRDRMGWTPLHHAAAKNRVEVAKLLLDAGADPNRLSELGGTPLHEAAAGGGVEMVRLLLARGTNPSIRSKPGVTALDLAREYKNADVIKFLESEK